MDYKSIQKAMAERLGSQFGLSVLISFTLINWELIFNMFDSELSIDDKIVLVKLWDFRLGWFVGDVFIIILIFQIGNLIARTAGTYINQVLWGKILKVIGDMTKYVDRDLHELALKDRDDYKEMRDNYSAEIAKLKEEIVDKQKTIENFAIQISKLKKDLNELEVKRRNGLDELKNKSESTNKIVIDLNNDAKQKDETISKLTLATAAFIDHFSIADLSQVKDRTLIYEAINRLKQSFDKLAQEQAQHLEDILEKN